MSRGLVFSDRAAPSKWSGVIQKIKIKKKILSDVSARLTGLHVTKEGKKRGEAGLKGGEKKEES